MDKLVFVYNADSGIVNGLLDYAHKTFSPQTYACNLCALTYGYTGMRAEWRRFLRNLRAPVEFVHRDELRERYCVEGVALPTILALRAGILEVWMSATAINACNTLDELRSLVSARTMDDLRTHQQG